MACELHRGNHGDDHQAVLNLRVFPSPSRQPPAINTYFRERQKSKQRFVTFLALFILVLVLLSFNSGNQIGVNNIGAFSVSLITAWIADTLVCDGVIAILGGKLHDEGKENDDEVTPLEAFIRLRGFFV